MCKRVFIVSCYLLSGPLETLIGISQLAVSLFKYSRRSLQHMDTVNVWLVNQCGTASLGKVALGLWTSKDDYSVMIKQATCL